MHAILKQARSKASQAELYHLQRKVLPVKFDAEGLSVIKAKQIIQTTGANLLGTVLNRRRHPVPGLLYRRV